MDVFDSRRKKLRLIKAIRRSSEIKIASGDDAEKVFDTCPSCHGIILKKDLKRHSMKCPLCGFHYKLSAYERIEMVVDGGSFHERNGKMEAKDVLNFPGYKAELRRSKRQTGLREAFVYGTAAIYGKNIVIGVLDGNFVMGSMGTTVGSKVTLCLEYAGKHRLPVILFTASGGARMQEGTASLMQMAKTAAAMRKFDEDGGLCITCLTNPTTGGVTASFAMLGDIIIGEPGALIGFAGPRVIEQTIGHKLPEGFQRSEFLLQHGFLDMIVERESMKDTLDKLIRLHERRA